MKLTIILLTAGFLNVAASGVSQTVTYSGKAVSLMQVFDIVKKQTGYSFFYDQELIEDAPPVTVDVSNEPLNNFLATLLAGKFSYQIDGKNIIVGPIVKNKPTSEPLVIETTPPIKISGTVVGINNQPLSGATIRVKGKNIITTSDEKGYFELRAELGDILFISYIGFHQREYKILGDETIRVSLQQVESNMDTAEVIISTGYQKVSDGRFVGSVSQLDSTLYHRRAGMGILERLDGNVTGLQFNSKSTEAGELQVRGLSTLRNNSQPLIILDNFPYTYDLSTINPNDVESIVVLKDAAATSIWGARAGNGVIVISTKKGRYNQPFRINFKSNITIQNKPDLFQYPQISSSDFVDIEKFLFEKGYYSSILEDEYSRPIITPVIEILDKTQKGLIDEKDGVSQINAFRPIDYRNDLIELAYKKQISHQHHINMAGGNNVMNYQISIGFNQQGPQLKNTLGNNFYTINSNASIRITKNLEAYIGLNLNQSINRSTTLPSYKTYPYQKLVDLEGYPISVPNAYRQGYLDTLAGGYLSWQLKPLEEIRLANKNINSKAIIVNSGLTYKILPWINMQLQVMYAVNDVRVRDLQSSETHYARFLINKFTNLNSSNNLDRNPIPLGGILDLFNSNSNSYNIRSQINVSKKWRKSHLVTGLMAFEISNNNSESDSQRFYGYNPKVGSVNNYIDYSKYYETFLFGFDQIPTGSTLSEQNISRVVSLIANLSYTYRDKYTLYTSVRRDGANVFGVNTNNRWKPLWSVGAGWQINKEPFFNVSWLPKLKLRVSHGYSGNVNNAISGLPTIQYSSNLATYTMLTYASTGSAPNPDLRWEQVQVRNLALDFGIFKNRIEGSVEFFTKKCTDLISSVPFPPTSGVRSFAVNAASLNGKGAEINIGAKAIQGNKFSWDINFGVSYAKTKVTQVYLPNLYRASDFTGYGINPSVDRMAYSLSSYRWAGLDPITGDPQGYLDGKVSKEYTKIFNDSVDNQIIHGSSIPLVSGFIRNTLSWRGISLSMNITYKMNFYYRKPTLDYENLFSNWTGHNEYARRWQKPGDEDYTNVPSMIFPIPTELQGRDQFYRNSEINVVKGDNFRLNDFRIQYTVKDLTLSTLQNFNFFFYANNLNVVLWKRAKVPYDPDFVGGPNFLLTPPKTYTFGIEFNF